MTKTPSVCRLPLISKQEKELGLASLDTLIKSNFFPKDIEKVVKQNIRKEHRSLNGGVRTAQKQEIVVAEPQEEESSNIFSLFSGLFTITLCDVYTILALCGLLGIGLGGIKYFGININTIYDLLSTTFGRAPRCDDSILSHVGATVSSYIGGKTCQERITELNSLMQNLAVLVGGTGVFAIKPSYNSLKKLIQEKTGCHICKLPTPKPATPKTAEMGTSPIVRSASPKRSRSRSPSPRKSPTPSPPGSARSVGRTRGRRGGYKKNMKATRKHRKTVRKYKK